VDNLPSFPRRRDKGREPPRILRLAHVGMVVEEVESALTFWRDVLGLPLSHVEDVADQESSVAFLPLEGGEVELIQPSTDNSGIARYLAKRGPGIHHLCFEVNDLEGMLDRLKKSGVRLIQEQPVVGPGGQKIAFLHPQSTQGVLVELYQRPPLEPESRRGPGHNSANLHPPEPDPGEADGESS